MSRPSAVAACAVLVGLCWSTLQAADGVAAGASVDGEEAAPGNSDLADGFLDPPPSARPHVYWCWLDGQVSPPHVAGELQEMKDKGLSGVYIFDVGAKDPDDIIPAGPPFMGPESVAAIGRAVRDATEIGLDVGLITSSSWNAGGSWVKDEHAAMGLYHCQTVVEGPKRFAQPLPPPPFAKRTHELPLYQRDVAVLAMP